MNFRDKFWFLSNMYPVDINMNINGTDYTFKNAEAAFQAQKDLSRINEFTNLTGQQAKALGRQVNMRPDWNTYRDKAMADVINAKFNQHPDLMQQLKAIQEPIQEDNTWKDMYWGVYNGQGQNKLGQILMNIRDKDLGTAQMGSIKIIDGNIFDTTAPYIVHQVNAKGVMGAGLAKDIRADIGGQGFTKYRNYVLENGIDSLGKVIPTKSLTNPNRVYFNLVGQNSYGTDKQYTDYEALTRGIQAINNKLAPGTRIAIPYGMGAGLGGGDWNTIEDIIKKYATNLNVELYKFKK